MPNINVGFNFIQDSALIPIAQGNFVLDEQTGIIGNISGTIDGKPIVGLSDYRNPDNKIYLEPYFARGLTTVYDWSTTLSGVSFTDGVTQYNLSGTGTGFGNLGQPNDTLYASNGTTRTVNFNNDPVFRNQPVCFADGTRIRTSRGDVAVEELRVGELAVAVSGALRPVVWIGHRRLTGGDHPLPHDQQPIRIRRNAFGPGQPARDLSLSPGHPVLVGADADGEGGVLVPAMCLINGTTVTREPVASVTYWHVELDTHDILLAEGLAAESYLDWGDRQFFTESSDHALHNPDFVVPGLADRCRPVAVDGPMVEAERLRLAALFEADLTAHCAWDADSLGMPRL